MDIPPQAGRLLGSGRTASNVNTYQRAQNATANSLRDIAGREDIVTLVQTFYLRAFADPLIGPIFTQVVPLDLTRHLPIMADFWQTVLFKAGLYNRNALQVHFEIHAKEPLTPEHFNRWLQLWGQSVDELFSGDKAELAKAAAHQIAGSMLRRVTGRQASAHSTISLRPPAD
ncbi:group III truncated hemoglobin [Arthrobacter sp. GMC3]|uniref:group III truncated hemoglobin n=1 Tax=Arthrobacter sp. GMC3 TaxID=2058894 RepID=UPI001CA4C38D|nr:group III truncated hemoglobin [Arthrobacter sp. GMC3]